MHLNRPPATAVRNQANRVVRVRRRLTDAHRLRRLHGSLGQAAARMPGLVEIRRHSPTCVCLDFELDSLTFALDLRSISGTLELSVVGRGPLAKRVLRSLLVGRAPMVRNQGERHVLAHWTGNRIARTVIVEQALAKLQWLANLLQTLPHEADPGRPAPEGHLLTYWWDRKPNFGDAIGPWLVRAMTGRPVVNSRWAKPQPSLFTVGSVVGHLDAPGHQLWGSGLIKPLGPGKLQRIGPNRPAAIHAVRGGLTRHELTTKLGWEVPEVYGDPALLLPRYLEPARPADGAGEIAVVPHYSHKSHFAGVDGPGLNVVNVGNGLERVVAQIAHASHCISTSLHGIIIAHAYGVPWTWLRLGDQPLSGDAFKFEDFFSVLRRDEVSEATVSAEEIPHTDFAKLARAARRPAGKVSLEPLQDAFPAVSPGTRH